LYGEARRGDRAEAHRAGPGEAAAEDADGLVAEQLARMDRRADGRPFVGGQRGDARYDRLSDPSVGRRARVARAGSSIQGEATECGIAVDIRVDRSEEHPSELQSRGHL